MQKYNSNLIININGSVEQGDQLAKRIKASPNFNGHPIQIINFEFLKNPDGLCDADQRKLRQLSSSSRVYLIQHGQYRATTHDLQGNRFSDIASFLATYIKPTQLQDKSSLKFRFILCSGAGGDIAPQDSLLARVHANLGAIYGLDAEITGSTEIVMVNHHTPFKGKFTASWSDYFQLTGPGDPRVHRQAPGTKLSFRWNSKGEQVILDAYVQRIVREGVALVTEICQQVNPDMLGKVKELLQSVRHIARKKDLLKLNQSAADEIVRKLLMIDGRLKNEVPKELKQKINALTKRLKMTTGKASFGPKLTHRQMGPYIGINPQKRDEIIRRDIYGATRQQLMRMKKTDRERPFKQILQRDILNLLGSRACGLIEEGISLKPLISIADSLAAVTGILTNQPSNAHAKVDEEFDKLRMLVAQAGLRAQLDPQLSTLKSIALAYCK